MTRVLLEDRGLGVLLQQGDVGDQINMGLRDGRVGGCISVGDGPGNGIVGLHRAFRPPVSAVVVPDTVWPGIGLPKHYPVISLD